MDGHNGNGKNIQLNDLAQETAESLAEDGFTRQKPGENVYVTKAASGGRVRPRDVVENWYREGKYYKYGVEQPGNASDVYHFTQVVWKDTKSMGVGLASDKFGKLYLVCTYEPSGNVQGQYAVNVLQPKEPKVEVPSSDETGIICDEPILDCVKSLERVYAVPSEQLRVWSAWATLVGDLAVEWQRWIQWNIDLVLLLNERLQVAQDKINRGETINLAAREIDSEDLSFVTAEDDTEMPEPIKDFIRQERIRETYGMKMSKTTIAASREDFNRGKSAASFFVLGKSKSKIKFSDPKDWPLGRRWSPMGKLEEEETDEATPRQVPRVPRNEAEMVRYMKEFNHQATLFRSYYKHWLETAEQAIKEIGCRAVMPTWQVQAHDFTKPRESSKASSLGKSRSTLLKKDRPPSHASTKISISTSENGEEEEEEVFKDAVENPEELEDEEEESDATEDSTDATKSGSKSQTSTKNATMKSSVSVAGAKSKSAKSLGSTSTSKSATQWKRVTVTEAMKDEARADEDIPYFFYLRAWPDIDIAIDNDDEHVIEADPDRESIIANYKKLYFNLCDKPGKDGKPWI